MVLDIRENNKSMVKWLSILFSFSGFLFACTTAGKVQKNQPFISKVDTTSVMLMKDSSLNDSLALIKDVYRKVMMNKINFTTFNAKVKVEYQTKDGGDEANVNVRIAKDSMMWLSMRGLFGIEGARILVTPDSVKLINYLDKSVKIEGIGYLEQLSGLPLDFITLQDLIIGNPVFIDSNIATFSVNESNRLSVKMLGRLFTHLALLDSGDYKILESKLENNEAENRRNCTITYSGYENGTGVYFSTKREINLYGMNEMDVNMEYKSHSFNQEVSFPFSIPKNYKK